MKFTLSTDTCCDNFKSEFTKNNIEYFPMKFICDSVEYEDNFNSAEDYNEFYNSMNNGKRYTTAGINTEEIKEYFLDLIKKHNKDIVHLSLSSGLSCTYQNVKLAAEEINENSKHKVFVLDTKLATAAMTFVLELGLHLRDEGISAEEAFEIMQNDLQTYNVCFFLNELDHLRRGGRISGAAAIIGKIAQIKPILTFTDDGGLQVISKVIGSKKALLFLFERFMNNYNGTSKIRICHGEGVEAATELKNMILQKFPEAEIKLNFLGPMICSHTGPSLIGMIFIQK